MHTRLIFLAILSVLPLSSSPIVAAPSEFEANLQSHIIIPASNTLTPPANAPKDFTNSGKYTGRIA